MLKEQKKLSIIISVYNSEEHLKKCLNRLLEQSYKNIEIIIVNDCSQRNCEQIADEYRAKDGRIKYIKHSTTKGPLKAKITGTSIATGEYITFINSEDYVSIDYYRTLMNNIQNNNSDIAIGNITFEYNDGKCINNLIDAKQHMKLVGEECLEQYFKQEGLSLDWNVVWNKIYKREIWDEAIKHCKKINTDIVIAEDFAFSTVLFYYAKKITRNENDTIFHCEDKYDNSQITIKKKIEDLTASFDFVERFLKETYIYDKYKNKVEKWKSLYCNQVREDMLDSKLTKEEINELDEKIKRFCPNEEKIKNAKFMYSIKTPWNDYFENIKLAICNKNIKCVSFDIFDTLIKRPFFVPTDLFTFLSRDYRKITNTKTGMDFAKLRIAGEQLTREKIEKKHPDYQDVTLDEIYKTINEEYGIDENVLEQLKNKEIEYELRFCEKRNSGYELYELALALGKNVICTSDMYLSKEVVSKILEKNGYTELKELYVSSELRITKSNGELFEYVLKAQNIQAQEMLHIGDNWHSDVQVPKNKYKINTKHLPKATDVAMDKNRVNNLMDMLTKNMPFWRDNAASMNFVGIRTMMAMVANKYFDNPFKTFNIESDFNADPYLIGYYAIGMYVYGLTKWLLDDTSKKNYEKLVFMARDGYLPIKAYKLMKQFYINAPKEEYFYVSRKALVPVTIIDKLDFYKLPEVLNVENHTPRDVLIYIKDSINVEEENFYKICEENDIKLDKEFKTIKNFNRFISIVINNFFDEEKHKNYLSIIKEYFTEIFGNNPATFDIGYSGRPELFISNLYGKPIDTYFCNINHEEALRHSDIAGFELNTFFDAKPPVTGFTYETMLSSLAPSCIAYNIKGGKVTPVFEEYNKNYYEEFVISIMQEAAMEFINDMINTFGEDIKILYYQNYYISLPIMSYMNSAKRMDRGIFEAINFENDVSFKEQVNMATEWEKEMNYKNQLTMQEMINSKIEKSVLTHVELENRSKLMKMIFYMLYDRPTFRRRMNEIFGKHKLIYGTGKFFYRALRKARNITYGIVHKIKK